MGTLGRIANSPSVAAARLERALSRALAALPFERAATEGPVAVRSHEIRREGYGPTVTR